MPAGNDKAYQRPSTSIMRRWSTLPTASAAYRGMFAIISSPPGVQDQLWFCIKTPANTYQWINLYALASGDPAFNYDFNGTVLDPDFTVTINGAGSVAMLVGAASVANGAALLRDTGAAGANDAQISFGTNRFISPALFPTYETRIAVTPIAGANGLRARAILHNAGAFGAVGNWIGLEFNAAVNANWRARSTVGGGAVLDLNTGIPVVAGAYYTYKLIILPDGSAIALLNNVVVATYTAAQVPAVLLEPLWYADDGGLGAGANCDMNVEFMRAWQSRV